MNKSEVKGSANGAKGKVKGVPGKVTGDKCTEYKGEAEKHDGKAEERMWRSQKRCQSGDEMSHATTPSRSRYDAADDMQAGATLLSAATITGNEVCNMQDEKLGRILDVVLDMADGEIRYAVLASGGFLGMGDRLFAVPWKALKRDNEHKRFMLDVDVERLKNAPAFDKDHWPNMAITGRIWLTPPGTRLSSPTTPGDRITQEAECGRSG